jgi:hypothetical protein
MLISSCHFSPPSLSLPPSPVLSSTFCGSNTAQRRRIWIRFRNPDENWNVVFSPFVCYGDSAQDTQQYLFFFPFAYSKSITILNFTSKKRERGGRIRKGKRTY